MDIKEIIIAQYLASLAMLKAAIEQCPAALWADPAYKNRFWHIAYHALFYAHLYLQPAEEDFVPWTKHHDQYQFMGPLPWPPHDEPAIGEPYSQKEVLDYLEFCRQHVPAAVVALDLAAESGFYWIPFNKLELQFYNIRHLQHHTGELCERLGTTASLDIDWVGTNRD